METGAGSHHLSLLPFLALHGETQVFQGVSEYGEKKKIIIKQKTQLQCVIRPLRSGLKGFVYARFSLISKQILTL